MKKTQPHASDIPEENIVREADAQEPSNSDSGEGSVESPEQNLADEPQLEGPTD